jgi:hypothetical protein
MQSVAGGNVSQKTAIVMAGVSKIFVGEIVETGTYRVCVRLYAPHNTRAHVTVHAWCLISSRVRLTVYVWGTGAARTVMEEWAETGPIRPRHLREAYRRLQLKGKIPSAATYSQKRLFRK